MFQFDLKIALATAFDVSTAQFIRTKDISAQDAGPTGIFFRADGLKMYLCGNASDSVHEYDLSVAWDISSAVFLQSATLPGLGSDTRDCFFSPDGLNLYIPSATVIGQLKLSAAWDVSTRSLYATSSVAAVETSVVGIYFRDDGLRMYIIGQGSDEVNQYSLSDAWNVTSTSHVTFKSIAAQDGTSGDVFFHPEGTKMWMTGQGGNDISEYDLSDAWNVSTAAFTQAYSIAAQGGSPRGMHISPNGEDMYVIEQDDDGLDQYSMADPEDEVVSITRSPERVIPVGRYGRKRIIPINSSGLFR